MTECYTASEETLSNSPSNYNGRKLNILDKSMEDNINVGLRPPLPAELVARDISALLRSYAAEEDDSSQSSSSGTEIFDLSSTGSASRKGNWKVDLAGNWVRDGSLESATSTGISSVCSSIAAEDKSSNQSQETSPSRKRMSDGSIKPSIIRLSSRSNAIPQVPALPAEPTQHSPAPQQTPQKKRRGRPPKDKSVSTAITPTVRRASIISKLAGEVRPRSSIPSRLPVDVFASQCIDAAYASRLNPYSLHAGEHALLMDLIMHKEVTVYLNIRNAILRLWHQNPLCSVTTDEAAGCAKEARFFGLAEVAYKWLVRNGHINFGCVQVPRDPMSHARSRRSSRQRTVVVVGAGVSGLTAARQLEGLFAQDSAKWTDAGERPPRVIVLEGRQRIGGRIYSKPLRSQKDDSLPGNLRNTAEMGAMIVTGFEHGNPLDSIIRGQLGLRYHLMKDALTIYDSDGKAVDEHRDMLNTELYTDISDRAGEFRAMPQESQTLKGDEELIQRCRDPAPDGFEHFQVEPLFDPIDNTRQHKPATKRGRRRNAPPGTEKLTGRTRIVEGSNATQSAARAARTMGWQLKEETAKNQSISLHRLANASAHPTLGSVMDEAIKQYQDLIQLTPQDMRLLNWHHANLEYANAAPVSSLSLSGHDQDTGNEFEGAHSEIIGGYTQLPRGLMNLPTKLDVRLDRVIESIHYSPDAFTDGDYSTKIVCTDGEVIGADEVVLTAPLGVLKSDMIDFDPPLPQWKRGAIERMGFGLLNKVVLLYDEPFWDDSRDMFGLLNDEELQDSLDPKHYQKSRGKFYLIWNASKISGRPMLVALMAGHAAYEAETTDTHKLLAEVTTRLRKVFTSKRIPPPIEVIVTRWKRDPFTRGTYSYVGPETRPGDYDLMAQSIGNLHFAGEATCGTHPATVHGAFLSGLRVAAEVMDAMAGPIGLPTPLVGPASVKQEVPIRSSASTVVPVVARPAIGSATFTLQSNAATVPFIKQESEAIVMANLAPVVVAPVPKKLAGPPAQSVCAVDASFWAQPSVGGGNLDYDAAIIATILSQIGERPVKPSRPGVNPFLLFTKDKWEECKAYCSRTGSKMDGKDAIRSTLGKWWKAAGDEVKQPYIVQSQTAQELADAVRKDWDEKVAVWDAEAMRVRREYIRDHPPPPEDVTAFSGSALDVVGVSKRKTNVSNCVVLDHA